MNIMKLNEQNAHSVEQLTGERGRADSPWQAKYKN